MLKTRYCHSNGRHNHDTDEKEPAVIGGLFAVMTRQVYESQSTCRSIYRLADRNWLRIFGRSDSNRLDSYRFGRIGRVADNSQNPADKGVGT